MIKTEKLTKLCITYRLERDTKDKNGKMLKYIEGSENCIVTVFEEKIAVSILRLQMSSPYVQAGCPGGIMHQWINKLAVMQGYDRGYFVQASEVDI